MNHQFKLVLFDMDETLLAGRTIHVVGEKKGFKDAVVRLEESTIVSYKKKQDDRTTPPKHDTKRT